VRVTIKTAAERLSEIDDAISVCLSAQSASEGDWSLVRARLSELQAMRREVYQQYLAETGGYGILQANRGIIRRE
jgi:hypothetical protein